MAGKIRERFGLIIDKYAEISGSIQELKNGVDTAGGPGSGYGSVLKNIGELEAEISKFKV